MENFKSAKSGQNNDWIQLIAAQTPFNNVVYTYKHLKPPLINSIALSMDKAAKSTHLIL
jgi:hypothetical protein